MSSKSPRSKKATGPSGTQSHPYTRGYQKTLEQFPNLAVTSAEEAASLQVMSEMSGVPMSGTSLSYFDPQALGPIPVQVPVPFSSLPADNPPTSASRGGSPYVILDPQRSASGRSTRSSRQSPVNNDGGDRTVRQTMVLPPPEPVSSSSEDEEDAQTFEDLQAATSAEAQVATSGVQLPANRASRTPSQCHSQRGTPRTSVQDPLVQDPLVRDPLLYVPSSADQRYYFEQARESARARKSAARAESRDEGRSTGTVASNSSETKTI